MPKNLRYKKYKLKDIANLRYGIIHSQCGFSDGVSIVMDQIERTLIKWREIPKENFFYLVGKSKHKQNNISTYKRLWHKHPVNKYMIKYFETGYPENVKNKIEESIKKVQKKIKRFIKKNKIDVLIVHNSSHPVNFISSVALARHYKECVENKIKTPKYILWWHDSHLERKRFSNPAKEVEKYLIEGVPGPFVDYIIFINSTQFQTADKYFQKLDDIKPGYYDHILEHNTVVYNTTDVFIKSFKELEHKRKARREEEFVEQFKIKDLLKNNNLDLNDVQFVLQHTRIVQRKRIEFAIEYCFELYKKLKKEKVKKSLILFVSGHSGDELDKYKQKLKRIYKKLIKKENANKFFLIFAEDFKDSTIMFEEFPIIFATLRGISTFFSEVEGFGNNLLEVMANGLVPIVYTYPVFISDIEDKGFKIIKLKEFEITKESVNETVDLIKSTRKMHSWVNENLVILKKRFAHKLLSRKIARAIIRKRLSHKIKKKNN